MAGITLAQIREAAEKKYGPFDIPDVEGGPITLLNPLRLSKAKRKQLADMQTAQKDPKADQDKLLRDMVRLVAQNKEQADRLLLSIGDDMPVLVELLNEYGRASQTGEASPSPS